MYIMFRGLILLLFISGVYNYEPIKVDVEEFKEKGVTKVFTLKELSKYDGTEEGKNIFMSIKGIVFDVTEGARFYGEGGSYHGMAGKDVTRAMGTQNLEEKDYISDITGLTDKELETMDQMYEKVYLRKYKPIGFMNYLVRNARKRDEM